MPRNIPKPSRPIPRDAHLHKKIEPIREIMNRGTVINSATVRAVRLPDGRVRLFLTAQGRAQLGL